MLDLESWVVTNMSRAEKQQFADVMHRKVNYLLKIEYAEPPEGWASYELIGLMLKHNPPKEAKAILQRYSVSEGEITRFLALYTADYKIYNSDILQPEEIGLRLLIFSGSHPGDDA